MRKLMIFIGTTVGGSIGWWLGDFVGMMTVFMLSTVGTGLGMYYAIRASRNYE